jgi:hypothetical protein
VFGHVVKVNLEKSLLVLKRDINKLNGQMKKLRNISMIDLLSTLVKSLLKETMAKEILKFMEDFQVFIEKPQLFPMNLRIQVDQ